MMGAAKFGRPQIVELGVTLGQTASMPSPDAAARHTGAGVARRQAHHERMRDERAREAAAGDAELPPEDDAVEMASAAQLLDSVAEVGPNYTLLRSKETKAKRRKRKREDARAALDGHTVLSTGSRLEIFCDSERWYPATVMAREEDGDGRIVHEVEYDGYPDRRWWHMLDDERWRAVLRATSRERGGVGIAAGYLQKPGYTRVIPALLHGFASWDHTHSRFTNQHSAYHFRIPLYHTTSKLIKISPNTGLIPVKFEHCDQLSAG